MDSDSNIVLGCPTCHMMFFIEALTEDVKGDIPNPLFCPFCAAPDLVEGFDIDEIMNDHSSILQEDLEMPRHKPLPIHRAALTVLPGGKSQGGQNGEGQENRNPDDGSAE